MKRTYVSLFIAILVLISLGGLNIYKKATWFDITDGIVWKESRAGLVAVSVDQTSEAYLRAGIRKGDILSAINKIPVKTRIDVLKNLLIAAATDQKVIYEINREGFQSYPSFFPQKKGPDPIYFYIAVVGLATSILIIVVFLNSKGKTAFPYIYFYLLSLSFAYFSVFSPTGRLDFLDQIFYWLDKVSIVLFPPLMMNFFLIFPLRKKILSYKPNLMTAIYVPALLILLARIRLHLPFPGKLDEASALSLVSRLDHFEMLHFVILGLATLLIVADSSFRAKASLMKKQLGLILFGLIFGLLPFVIFYALPYLAGEVPTQGMELTVLLQALLPMTFFYSISRTRLVDVEVILKKAATLIFSFFVIAVLYLLLSARTKLFSENRLNAIALGILAIILSVTLFTPLKKLFQTLFDRIIYRRSYQHRQTLLFISREMSRERNLKNLANLLLEAISKALSLRTIAILLIGEDELPSFHILGIKGNNKPLPDKIQIEDDIFKEMQKKDYLTLYSIAEDKQEYISAEFFHSYGFVHILPLKIENKIIGCILMGKKLDGSLLSREDWELITTISSSAALALENAYLYSRETIRTMEMQRLKDYSENIIESLTVGVAVINENGTVIGWNRVLDDQFGIKKESALGKPLSEVLGLKNYYSIFPSGSEQGYHLMSEISLETKNEGKRIFDIARTPLLDNALQSYGIIIVFEDVTEKVQLQQQLVTSEKLASIGLLSAGVAHEINTPLTGISSYIQLLQKRLTDVHYTEILKKVESQTERVAKIIKNLLAFARNPSDSSFHRTDIKENLEEIISLIDYKLKNMNINLELNLEPVPLIYVQPERLQQVFINIILNAIDAMPKGGSLSIKLHSSGNKIIVQIADSGCGIKPEHLPHIFDPFFTTKGIGKGTGLGLSISYAIVKDHEGEIQVESEVDRGSKFTIYLPIEKQVLSPPRNSVLRT